MKDERDELLRMRSLRQRIPVAASTIWEWVRQGKFPKPFKLSESVTVWRLDDIEQWLAVRSVAKAEV